ncbi:IS66 family insertion sequence element accessory protein TnpB [Cupriavidus alkaliphilus]|uniref:IS66 family insertion sequence element accessory protein TnpB n=1 Tax=Cupriavidus alkaliphilus TaxID=942866 RepID=UPI0035D4BAF3
MEPPANTRIWVAAGLTDMRCGFDGLAAKVQTVLQKDPFSGHAFLFRGKRGDLLKCLTEGSTQRPPLKTRRQSSSKPLGQHFSISLQTQPTCSNKGEKPGSRAALCRIFNSRTECPRRQAPATLDRLLSWLGQVPR